MPRENKTQYAILGFLQYQPMSGYDIKKCTEGSVSYFWQENYGHIYPVLSKLLKQGLVTSRTEVSEAGPERKVYSITKKGEEAFSQWIDQESEPERYRNELLLKLFFIPANAKQQMIGHIQAEKSRHEKLLLNYKKIQSLILEKESDEHFSPAWLFTVKNGIFTSRAQIDWCHECLEHLQHVD